MSAFGFVLMATCLATLAVSVYAMLVVRQVEASVEALAGRVATFVARADSVLAKQVTVPDSGVQPVGKPAKVPVELVTVKLMDADERETHATLKLRQVECHLVLTHEGTRYRLSNADAQSSTFIYRAE